MELVDKLNLEPIAFNFYFNGLFILISLFIYFKTKTYSRKWLYLSFVIYFWSFNSDVSVLDPGKLFQATNDTEKKILIYSSAVTILPPRLFSIYLFYI